MRLIDEDALKEYCAKAADVSKGLYETVMDKIGHGESAESAIGAMAWFMQRERMYRHEIPSVIDAFEKEHGGKSGTWVNTLGNYQVAECSECESWFEVCGEENPTQEIFNEFGKSYRFCPNCGAKMDGRRESEGT